MKILSIDTSSKICSVAILENTTLLKEISINNGYTHSEILMPTIKQLVEETNLKLKGPKCYNKKRKARSKLSLQVQGTKVFFCHN